MTFGLYNIPFKSKVSQTLRKCQLCNRSNSCKFLKFQCKKAGTPKGGQCLPHSQADNVGLKSVNLSTWEVHIGGVLLV